MQLIYCLILTCISRTWLLVSLNLLRNFYPKCFSWRIPDDQQDFLFSISCKIEWWVSIFLLFVYRYILCNQTNMFVSILLFLMVHNDFSINWLSCSQEEIAVEFSIPSQFQRLWLFCKRQNGTWRPVRPFSTEENNLSVRRHCSCYVLVAVLDNLCSYWFLIQFFLAELWE